MSCGHLTAVDRHRFPCLLLVALLLISLGAATDPAKCSKPPPVQHFGSAFTFQRFPEPALVPWPASIVAENDYLKLSNKTTIGLLPTTSSEDSAVFSWLVLWPLGQLLAQEIRILTGGELKLQVKNTTSSGSNDAISLRLDPHRFGEEESSMVVSHSGVIITAGTYAALSGATVSLLQSIEHSADHDAFPPTSFNCSTKLSWRVPYLSILDRPELLYRGVHVDAARKFLSLPDLKKYVLLCRFYKLNYLYVHLSDDNAFTWPSTAFPELANTSQWKYTLADMHELREFANARGVTILGEVDVPGHAKFIVKTLPALFGFPSSPTLGIINFVDPTVITRLQTIFNEISQVLPSPYLALGTDEVDFEALGKVPEVIAAIKAQSLKTPTDLYRKFINQMNQYALSRGMTLHVWEGFASQKGGGSPPYDQPASTISIDPTTNITVSPYDLQRYPPPQLAIDGYRIINTAVTPLYFFPGFPPPLPEMVYQWNPWLFGDNCCGRLDWYEIPKAYRSALVGVEVCEWETPAAEALSMLVQLVPAIVDRSWNPWAMRSFADYQSRANRTTQLLWRLLA